MSSSPSLKYVIVNIPDFPVITFTTHEVSFESTISTLLELTTNTPPLFPTIEKDMFSSYGLTNCGPSIYGFVVSGSIIAGTTILSSISLSKYSSR